MHSTGWVKLGDPDAKIKFLAAEALEEEFVVLSLTHSETVLPIRLRYRESGVWATLVILVTP